MQIPALYPETTEDTDILSLLNRDLMIIPVTCGLYPHHMYMLVHGSLGSHVCKCSHAGRQGDIHTVESFVVVVTLLSQATPFT